MIRMTNWEEKLTLGGDIQRFWKWEFSYKEETAEEELWKDRVKDERGRRGNLKETCN